MQSNISSFVANDAVKPKAVKWNIFVEFLVKEVCEILLKIEGLFVENTTNIKFTRVKYLVFFVDNKCSEMR